ncbi:MAG TPA: TraR/DksA C4-type zinc finger protein [Acidimicrobiales bacterium]
MDSADARRHLSDEHDRLERLRAVLESDHVTDEPEEDSSGELSHVDQHPADVASDAFEREKTLSILEQVQAELAAVERALQRIDDGSYGRCEACGDAIDDERLAVVPAARFCLDHQSDLET